MKKRFLVPLSAIALIVLGLQPGKTDVPWNGNLSTNTFVPAGTTVVRTIASALRVPVTQRPPSATDDTNASYKPGDLWWIPTGFWRNVDATAGKAIWAPLQRGVLPLDVSGGSTCDVAYGTRKLRAAYAGKAFQAAVANVATDISLLSADGSLDGPGLVAALGPAPAVTATTSPQTWAAGVLKWYDQSVGAANDTPTIGAFWATSQVEAGNAVVVNLGNVYKTTAGGTSASSGTGPTGATPAVDGTVTWVYQYTLPGASPLVLTGGNPEIAFWSGGLDFLILNRRLPLPSGLTVNSRNFSLLSVVRSSGMGSNNYLVDFAGTFPINVLLADQAPDSRPAGIVVGPVTDFGFAIPSTPSVFQITGTASALTANQGDLGSYSGAAVSALTTTGAGFLGGASIAAGGYGLGTSAFIKCPSLTATQLAAMQAALVDTFKLFPQIRARLIVDGDSIAAGAEGSLGLSSARYIESLLTQPVVVWNTAQGGDFMSHRDTAFAAEGALLYDPKAPINLYMQEAGINDLCNRGDAGATVYSHRLAWVAQVNALGSNAKSIVRTTLPNDNSSDVPSSLLCEAQRQVLLGLDRANSAGAHQIADQAANPVLGIYPTSPNDATLYNSDKIHPLPYAISLEAQIEADGLNRAAQ